MVRNHRWGARLLPQRICLNLFLWMGLARFIGLNYPSITRKYAVFWQPGELIVFGMVDTRLELWKAAELSECQDALVSGVLSCDDIRAV